MTRLRNRRNRAMALLAAFLMLTAGQAASPLAAATTPSDAAQPPDLAAMVLTPMDLAAEGLDGYGSDYGELLTVEQIAAGFAAAHGRPLDEAIDIYDKLRLVQSYSVRIAEATVPGDFNSVATATVSVSLVEYEDTAGSTLAFNIAEADVENAGHEIVDGTELVGDRSFLVGHSGVDDAGDPYAELAIEFLLGRFHGSVAVADVATFGEANDPMAPDGALVEALGIRSVERIVEGGGSGSLGLRAIRLMSDEASVVTVGDRYNAIDGVLLPRFAETEDELAGRTAQLEADGMVAVYSLEQDVRADAADNDPRAPHLTVRLFQFVDSTAASAWFETGAYDRFAADPYLDSIEPIDTSMYQDENRLAAAYTAEYGGAELEGLVMWVLVDDVVARISLDAVGGVSPFALTTLMKEQVTCLAARACDSPVTVPKSLLP